VDHGHVFSSITVFQFASTKKILIVLNGLMFDDAVPGTGAIARSGFFSLRSISLATPSRSFQAPDTPLISWNRAASDLSIAGPWC
jgi:hypothetical protein